MKKIIYIITLMLCYSTYGQSFFVYDVDTNSFPAVKAKFYVFDAVGNQITNFSNSDFEVKEKGQIRNVINITCPISTLPKALSSVLVIDVSSSMADTGLSIAKEAAKAWINLLPQTGSECAITSFNEENYLNQDFTSNKIDLINAVNSLESSDGTDYNAALIEPSDGGILVAKTGKDKKVIVFISDGGSDSDPNTQNIISQANANNIVIYCINIDSYTPQCMKDYANQTGGRYFEYVRTSEQIQLCIGLILKNTQEIAPCQIEWLSDFSCILEKLDLEVKYIPNNLNSKLSYQMPQSSIASLEFKPGTVYFKNAIPDINKDTIITVTAKNSNFIISNITSSNPIFTINPVNFSLNAGQSINLTVSCIPPDSGYSFTKFVFENNLCPTKYYSSCGFPGKKPPVKTIKLIQPNGGEVLVVGMDTLITWEGILPNEQVRIEYSTNNGLSWRKIADTASGFSYNWRVPKTPGDQCLARVKAKSSIAGCDNSDIQICSQIWMGCNLTLENYKNGEPIRHATTEAEWKDAGKTKEGAWCYYGFDPANENIYGLLYNWYAVNDPRGLAPEGWHIPTYAELGALEKCLGGSSVAGGKLKSTGTIEDGDGLWESPNTKATNETGFTAQPAGFCDGNGVFYYLGSYSFWWSSSEMNTPTAFNFNLLFNGANSSRSNYDKNYGFSIRCLWN